jgi:nitrite reductase (NADH) small subunit
MSVMAERWHAIGTMDDIPRRGARRVNHGATAIAVFRTAEDRIFALEDKCPHRGGPLSQGIVHGACVTCPLHNWVISLETGLGQGADEGSVKTIPVKVEQHRIFLAIDSITSTPREEATIDADPPGGHCALPAVSP